MRKFILVISWLLLAVCLGVAFMGIGMGDPEYRLTRLFQSILFMILFPVPILIAAYQYYKAGKDASQIRRWPRYVLIIFFIPVLLYALLNIPGALHSQSIVGVILALIAAFFVGSIIWYLLKQK